MNAVYVIAEAGVNHNGQRDLAFALVDAAAATGADAVKFQTFDAEKLASRRVPKAAYQKQHTGADESQLAMLKKLELPREWHCDLQAHAKQKNITFLSTAFDVGSLDFLIGLNLPLFKIPSGEITNGPLLWRFARAGKPLILSTGMSTLEDVENALAVLGHGMCHTEEPRSFAEVSRFWNTSECRQALTGMVTLLHCMSQYPAPMDQINLRAMNTLAKVFDLPVGYSDHTNGTHIAVAAVARGAQVIEKHFTLDCSLPGPDHKASLEPEEFTRMVAYIRDLEKAMGDGRKVPQPIEKDTINVVRQQIVAACNIAAGEVITRAQLATARSGKGLSPHSLWELVGSQANKAYAAGDPI